jgi:hypothetical protein
MVAILGVVQVETVNAIWVGVFGVSIGDAPTPTYFLITFIAVLIPFIVPLGLGFRFAASYFRLRDDPYERGKVQLGEARAALEKAQVVLVSLESDYAAKLAALKDTTDQLDSVRALQSDEFQALRKKINALDLVRAKNVWIERVLSFLFGVISSLIASLIWEWATAL